MKPWLGSTSRLLVVSLGLAAPATAGPVLLASAEREVARLDSAQATAAPAPDPAPTKADTGRSFFKTPKGIVATVLFAGLTGYAIHSHIADAVHSPGRN